MNNMMILKYLGFKRDWTKASKNSSCQSLNSDSCWKKAKVGAGRRRIHLEVQFVESILGSSKERGMKYIPIKIESTTCFIWKSSVNHAILKT